MRIFLVCIMAGMMFIMVGCGAVTQSAAVEQVSPQGETSQAQQKAPLKIEETVRGNRSAEDNENIQMGKIVSVSGDEITVELATIQRPERSAPDGEIPSKQHEENQEERKRPEGSRQPEDGGAKQGERKMPEGGSPNGGSRGFGGQTEFTYSGVQKAYALTENVKVINGMGEKSEALSIADLAKDDVVRLEFNKNGELVSIQLWNIPTDASNKTADVQD